MKRSILLSNEIKEQLPAIEIAGPLKNLISADSAKKIKNLLPSVAELTTHLNDGGNSGFGGSGWAVNEDGNVVVVGRSMKMEPASLWPTVQLANVYWPIKYSENGLNTQFRTEFYWPQPIG